MIYIYRGIPGSGKNYHAENHIEADIIVDSDEFFMEEGEYQFKPEQLTEAHTVCFRKWLEAIEKYARSADSIAVCNTNITRAEYTPYVQAARAAGFKQNIRLVHCQCPIETAIERNIHGVPPHVIGRMDERFEKPHEHDPTQLSVWTKNEDRDRG